MSNDIAGEEREAEWLLMDGALNARATTLAELSSALNERMAALLAREADARADEDAARVDDATIAELGAHNDELREVNERLMLATVAGQELRDEAEAARGRQNEFLAMLAHELRNPLGPIRTAVELLDRLDGKPIPAPVLQAMRRQVEQMVRLLDDLLDVSRVTHGKVVLQRRRTAVSEFVQQAVETCRDPIARKGLLLNVDLPATPIFVDGDLARLTQIVTNLLHNAVKYARDGGRIAIEVRRQGAAVVLRVRDDGIGISAEALPNVFELFAQDDRALSRAQGGLGIGLTVVRRMVELHGGTVTAASGGADQGSEFIVTLPCMPNRVEHERTVDTIASLAPVAARVLLIEDNVDAGDILVELLRMAGHAVTLARDGEAGLEQFEHTHPQVVLCDIGLPGIDGFEVVTRMHALGHVPRPAIVAITGYSGATTSARAFDAGFDEYVIKPVDPGALLRLVDSAIRVEDWTTSGRGLLMPHGNPVEADDRHRHR